MSKVVPQPGPVAVLYHSSALAQKVGPATRPRLYSTAAYLPAERRAASEEQVEAAVAKLGAAARPVIIAGNGVRMSGARAELTRDYSPQSDRSPGGTCSVTALISQRYPTAPEEITDPRAHRRR